MKAPLYNEILTLSQNIASASATDDNVQRVEACKALQKLCATNQDSPNDHPLQWEALADFTEDGDQALDIYQVGLNIAEKLTLNEYSSSIYLAMAQRYQEFEESEKCLEFAQMANKTAQGIKSEELKSEISEFISSITNNS
ncbi:MAG: hypothetical protein MJK12_18155 [Colwellia sp.]|nr:hypothetical protein [Colwellia sp.]